MNKKEFAVGETFQLGLKKLKVVEDYGCDKCFFEGMCNDISAEAFMLIIGGCASHIRADMKKIKYIEVEDDQCEK